MSIPMHMHLYIYIYIYIYIFFFFVRQMSCSQPALYHVPAAHFRCTSMCLMHIDG